jgi:NAD(P)-dependent dehydrogenase (short-subunit alcohol dehydrogenase family)
MTRTLITGANKGLGYEAARRLLEAGHEVWVGARDPERGAKAAAELGARFVQIDVTSDDSVDAAVGTVGSLDVLINNAGVMSSREDIDNPSADTVRECFETNVVGAVRVFRAFLPLLQASSHGVVVNVSSGLGSIAGTLRGDYANRPVAYAASKSALNMLSAQWSLSFPQLRINTANPGYTATDLNGNSGSQTVTEGTDAIVALATVAPDGPTGTFVDRDGAVDW